MADRASRRRERAGGYERGGQVPGHAPARASCSTCGGPHSPSVHRDHAVEPHVPYQFQKFLRGAERLRREDVRDGDVVLLDAPGISYASISGLPVTKANRKNLVIESEVRFAPDGPWFPHVHKVPREHVVGVVRGDVKYRVV